MLIPGVHMLIPGVFMSATRTMATFVIFKTIPLGNYWLTSLAELQRIRGCSSPGLRLLRMQPQFPMNLTPGKRRPPRLMQKPKVLIVEGPVVSP